MTRARRESRPLNGQLVAPISYDAYAASGHGGQRLIVITELDVIATFTAWNIYDERALTMEAALDRVLAAVQDRPR